MATVPQIKTLTNSSVDILNAIRNSATTNYRDYVPKATTNADSIKQIGAIIMDYPSLQNEFLSALVNRIGRVIVTSKMYTNPIAMFKKGIMDMGESLEEVFVNIAKPFQYDPGASESTVFKREIPDVRSAFHVMNYKKFYKVTVTEVQLRQAFLSLQGVTDLVSRIVESMYTGASYDEFQVMKYLLGRHLLNGKLTPKTIDAVSTDKMEDIVSVIKGTSNDLTFMSSDYNMAGVYTSTDRLDQYLLVNSLFDAKMDVNVLASAFNMEKAEFLGHRVLVDGFGKIDTKRLGILFADDATYTAFTEAELDALNTIPAVLIDRDFFMVFDNMYNFTEQYNGEGLYWNYWYHTWKTFSISPFANTTVFVPAVPAVTSVTVSPSTVATTVGQSVSLTATVVTTNFQSKEVNWTSADETIATVDKSGIVKAIKAGTVKITATSKVDASKKADSTFTIS